MWIFNKKVLFKKRLGGTFLFAIADINTQECYQWYFQFSLKDPWWLPRYEAEFGEDKSPLCGWLFFYFGRETKGVIVPASPDDKPTVKNPIYDKGGRLWHLYTFGDKQMAREFHKGIKKYKATVSVNDKHIVVNQITRRRVFGI